MTTRDQNNIYKSNNFYGFTASASHIPTTYKQAQNFHHWRVAMQLEYDALMKNNTWELVPRDPSKNVVDCKWVYLFK